MDLHLDIGRPGRQPSELTAAPLRELAEADLVALTVNRETKPSALKRLTDRHHAAARLLAAGMKPGAVAATLGYAEAHISILQADPAFNELLLTYRGVVDMEFRTTQERLSGVVNDALDLLQERMEDPDSREKITIPQAIALAELGADRTGHGPSATTTNVNIHVGMAEKLERARRIAREAAERNVIDITPEAAE